jgi:hypothetical protein
LLRCALPRTSSVLRACLQQRRCPISYKPPPKKEKGKGLYLFIFWSSKRSGRRVERWARRSMGFARFEKQGLTNSTTNNKRHNKQHSNTTI